MVDLMQTLSNFGYGKALASIAIVALFVFAIVKGGKGSGKGDGGSSTPQG